MAIFENLMSRLGYVKLDPYRRELLARAELAAGLTAAPLPAAVFVPEALPPAPPVPPAMPRVARGSVPPIPPSPPPRAPSPPEDATVVDPRPRADAATADDDGGDEEWEWRMAMARARARADEEEEDAPTTPQPPYVPSLPRPVHGQSRRPKGEPPHRRLPLTATSIREGWQRR